MARCGFSLCLGLVAAVSCVPDLGDLGELPEVPTSPVPPLFEPVPLDASAPLAEPEPEPEPVQPVVPSSPTSPEPEGRGAITLLHGAIDAPHGAFCAVLEDAEGVRVSERPLPEAGLEFGEALVVPMSEQIDPATTDVQFLFVAAESRFFALGCRALLLGYGYELPEAAFDVELASRDATSLDAGAESAAVDGGQGEFSLGDSFLSDAQFGRARLPSVGPTFDSSRRDASAAVLDASLPHPDASIATPPLARDAGALPDAANLADANAEDAGFVPPDVRVAELPRLLAGTYSDRSYLFATGGCLGAPGFDDGALDRCGPGFADNRSSFSAVFVGLSRLLEFDAVGLQVVHAGRVLGELSVRSDPGETEGTFFTLASSLLWGAIQPFTAQRSVGVAALGEPLTDVGIEVATWPGGVPLLTVPWTEVLAANAVELRDGRAYTLVVIGGIPGESTDPYINPAWVSVVESDPLRE
jgi:hypothetical protein